MTAKITRVGQASLPAPSELELIEIHASHIRQLVYRRYADGNIPALRGLLVEIDQALPGAPALAKQLESLQRPATKQELADHISVLRIGFSNAKTVEGFSRVLIERIAARQPRFGAINWAVRRLIDYDEFAPTIAKVVKALAAAQADIDAAQAHVARLPRLRDEIAEMIKGDGR